MFEDWVEWRKSRLKPVSGSRLAPPPCHICKRAQLRIIFLLENARRKRIRKRSKSLLFVQVQSFLVHILRLSNVTFSFTDAFACHHDAGETITLHDSSHSTTMADFEDSRISLKLQTTLNSANKDAYKVTALDNSRVKEGWNELAWCCYIYFVVLLMGEFANGTVL